MSIMAAKGKLTPKRIALSAAIEALAEERKAHGALERAIDAAKATLDAAYERLGATAAEVAEAIEAQTDGLINSARAGARFEDGGRLNEAQSAERQAAIDIEAAKAALASLESRRPDTGFRGTEGPIERAHKVAIAAVDDVIRDEADIEPLLKRALEMQDQLMNARAELVHLLINGFVPYDRQRFLQDFLENRVFPGVMCSGIVPPAGKPFEHVSRIHVTHSQTGDAFPSEEPWKSVRAALLLDPHTPLPAAKGTI